MPTSIKAARMDYNANAQVVVFSGNVHVKRPDFELWSGKLTVYLDKSGKATTESGPDGNGMQAGDIDRIVAEKDVRMKSGDKEGSCDTATYYAKEDKFVMEGNPVLKDSKQSRASGGTVVHYFKTNQSQVLNGAMMNFYAPDSSGNSLKGMAGGEER
ncbi:LptA/OstA family protein [Desulfovibrio sp. OttesenSCG-928-A18]|nr:LptA/OstA family protein [Desulfovibrio sp. OttesenSCG-928-A18]